jgi:hypothetical protein
MLRKPNECEDKMKIITAADAILYCSERSSECLTPGSDRRHVSSYDALLNLEDGLAAVSRDRAKFIQNAAFREGARLFM